MHATRTSAGQVYRPRNPRTTALYQCASRHARELKAGSRFGRRVEENVVGRFLECGRPFQGTDMASRDHAAVVDAIRERDSRRAEAAMRRHILSLRHAIFGD